MITLITLDEILMLGKKPNVPVPVNGWIAGGAIRGWFSANEKLSDVDVFFKHKQALDDYQDGKVIHTTPLSIVSTLRNHLGVHKLEGNVVDSLRRAFKYTRKGFYPCNGSLQKIAHSLRGLSEQQVNDAIEISPNGGRRIVRFD